MQESLFHLAIYYFYNFLEYSEILFQSIHFWTSLNYRNQQVVVYVLKLSLLGAFRCQLSAIDLKMFDQSHRFAIGHGFLIWAPNDVIWKHELYFLMFNKKHLDSDVAPVCKVFNGSGGVAS